MYKINVLLLWMPCLVRWLVNVGVHCLFDRVLPFIFSSKVPLSIHQNLSTYKNLNPHEMLDGMENGD